MTVKNQVVVRFPPSPTGLLHMGNVRTALYNYLFARQNGGKFLLRIEDTDAERSNKEYEESIFDDLEWLGLDYDNAGKVWRQTERTEIYKQKIQDLIKKGSAYISEESEGQNKEVVRFHNPGGKIKFQDLIRGEVEMETGDLGDFIIARNINDPLYHLAVSVDDAEAGITHVIRGEDHISNTPRQIMIIEALGGQRPIYAHLPLILALDKSKLTKRKHGEAVSLRYYRERGYEREALINFLAFIGWNPGDDREIFSLDDLVKNFDLSKVQKKGAVFNIEKLNWINKQYITRQSKDEQISKFKIQISKTKWNDSEKFSDENFFEHFLAIMLDRIHRWGEVSELLDAGEFDYLFIDPKLDKSLLPWKNSSAESAKNNLKRISEILESNSDIEEIKKEISEFADSAGKGDVLWPLRYSLSGREKSPDPMSLLETLGIETSKRRIEQAILTLE